MKMLSMLKCAWSAAAFVARQLRTGIYLRTWPAAKPAPPPIVSTISQPNKPGVNAKGLSVEMRTADDIDRMLVAFGRAAARTAENLSEEETADYLTDFLRVAVSDITGVPLARQRDFQLPTILN